MTRFHRIASPRRIAFLACSRVCREAVNHLTVFRRRDDAGGAASVGSEPGLTAVFPLEPFCGRRVFSARAFPFCQR